MNTIYRVVSGDTLANIAASHAVTLEQLLQLNPQISNPNLIFVGQPINIPIVKPKPEAKDFQSLWYQAALGEMESGVSEVPGADAHNPRILEYHQTTTLGASDDETAWCSSFVNWCVEQSGLTGTRSAAARSWLTWGSALQTPVEGCILILKRGKHPWQGHVGFYVGEKNGAILVLGGNQSDSVNISSYAAERLLGYRTHP
ncbi:cell wall-associated hydrolases [Vibrio ishigakensis]|uniref:Cell wall-associated hydrolases n=1 Tax=Vibrio ishigakensis TaxID=1481914 RepID=A0A0B8P3N9_9VIBR|nr:cell wall-associated hydrolases [Vibrio ishigakensis]